jgi:hypothetical protein
MDSSSAFAKDGVFAPGNSIKFGSLDFLTNTTGELHVISPDAQAVTSLAPQRSTRSSPEKQHRKKWPAALKRFPDGWQVGEAPSPTSEAATNRQQTSGGKHRHESISQEVYAA